MSALKEKLATLANVIQIMQLQVELAHASNTVVGAPRQTLLDAMEVLPRVRLKLERLRMASVMLSNYKKIAEEINDNFYVMGVRSDLIHRDGSQWVDELETAAFLDTEDIISCCQKVIARMTPIVRDLA